MRRFYLTQSGLTVALLCGLSLPAFAQTQSEPYSERRQQQTRYEQESSMLQGGMQQRPLAQQEAQIARDAADLAERAAQLAQRHARKAQQQGMEQQATLAQEKAEIARDMAELANRRAQVAERKATRAAQQGSAQSPAIARQEAAIAQEAVELTERAQQLAQREARLAGRQEIRQRGAMIGTGFDDEQGMRPTGQGERSQRVPVTGQEQFDQRFLDLGARDTDRGLVLTLEDVLFEFDDDTLRPAARQRLAQLASVFQQYPDRRIRIEGHTDSSGDASYNEQLSESRAEAVRDFFVAQGIDTDRIVTRGYGQTKPLVTNDTEAGRQRNRRVEIVMVPQVDQFAEREDIQ